MGEEPSMEEMERLVRESLDDPEVVVGWVHGVEVKRLYDGLPGVGLTVTILDGGGEVASAVLWVPGPGVPVLRQLLGKLRSPEFLRVFPAKLTGRPASRKPGKRRRP
ncbi:hypothetical protein LO762_23750 [Actinocorallia sp. API 0066]|uniref:hypothetical protein n=1 Tax=Actinocorallia sp. API 0066 TaxID=2896846 RepID=UPI001E4EDA07|nr:hypothetical protein [Actinocorallia sp. API 0066]MCD0452183.1 hypothetical protein [Actinocorallia sp. API 0066]